MEVVHTPPKTLVEGASPTPETSKSQNPGTKAAKESFKTSALGQENGVRVSVNGKGVVEEKLDRGVADVIRSKVVEAEKSFLGQNIGVWDDKDGVLEDSEINGVSSLLEMKERIKNDIHGARLESLKGLSSVLGVLDKNEEKCVVETGDGVSLVVDISGSGPTVGVRESRDLGAKDNGSALSKKGNELGGEFGEISRSKDGEGDDVSNEGHEFSVGDFIWGKIRSHPWWPGQIYDPSDASDFAMKVKQKDRILVAYFGDGTFAWCNPSQLKPFMENFEEMSKQSGSKNFVNAVGTAMDEIGKLVELKTTCSCVPKEKLVGINRPLALNGGIKTGVFVPESGVKKLSNVLFEPLEFLTEMKHAAQVASINNVLEFTVLKSWLSSFYRSKGAYQLPIYHEPQLIPGLEDDVRKWVVDVGDRNHAVEVPIQGPVEEEWLSSPRGSTFGTTYESLSEKCPGVSGDRMYQRRKQKSIAEILGGDIDAETETLEGDMAKGGTNSSKPVVSSGRKKRKGCFEADGIDGNNISLSRRRKETEVSGGPRASVSTVAGVENNGRGDREQTRKGSFSRKRKNEGSTIESDGGENKGETNESKVGNAPAKRKPTGGTSVQSDGDMAKEQIEKLSLLRERKKSKYLSPPYTNLISGHRKKEMEAGFLKVSEQSHVGGLMYEATSQFVGSPKISKCSSQKFQLKPFEELGPAYDNSSLQTPKSDLARSIDPMIVSASPNDVLLEIRSAALNLQYLKENNSLDMVEEFLSVFRSSIYRNGSNYRLYKKSQPGRKRETLNSEPRSSRKQQNQAKCSTPQPESLEMKSKKAENLKSEKPTLKQATLSSDVKINEKEIDERAGPGIKTNEKETDGKPTPASLFVAFGPGSSLPSKNDLIKIYGKFGALNKEETEMFYHNFCARIVFLKSSDAEEAFNDSQMLSPFGAATVSFRLRYSAETKTRELREISNPVPPPLAKEGGGKTSVRTSASKSCVGTASQLDSIRQKLEVMISTLEKSDGKTFPDMKSKLEGDIRGLLEEVNTMAESSSS